MKNGQLENWKRRRREYKNYLSSARWRNLRSQVLRRSRGKCEVCRCRDATEVHHLTYKRFKNELLEDLQAVCKQCHVKEHKRKRKDERKRNRAHKNWIASYREYLTADALYDRARVALSRAGGKCERCITGTVTEVGHARYDHIGNEAPEDLMALCHRCFGWKLANDPEIGRFPIPNWEPLVRSSRKSLDMAIANMESARSAARFPFLENSVRGDPLRCPSK